MTHVDTHELDTRILPRDVQYYFINEDGAVEESNIPQAETYIDSSDVSYFRKPDVMRHIRTVYGPHIGVMRDMQVHLAHVHEASTPKMLLGIVKPKSIST